VFETTVAKVGEEFHSPYTKKEKEGFGEGNNIVGREEG
jgi:hypothetical protein